MVEALTTALRRLSLLMALVAFPCAVFGHRLDEYLQATLVVIEPGEVRLEINLTPGVAVAQQVLAIIDRDRDGSISKKEAAAYADLLKRDLTLRADGHELKLNLAASDFPAPSEFRGGFGIIQIEFSATNGPFAVGAHTIALENRHLTNISAYLINATPPKSRSIKITRQKRNDNQAAGRIEFTFASADRRK